MVSGSEKEDQMKNEKDKEDKVRERYEFAESSSSESEDESKKKKEVTKHHRESEDSESNSEESDSSTSGKEGSDNNTSNTSEHEVEKVKPSKSKSKDEPNKKDQKDVLIDIDNEIEMSEFSSTGLSSEEAKRRLEKYGPNAIEEKSVPAWKKFVLKFWGPMPVLIEIAIVLSLVNAIVSVEHDYVSFVVLTLLLIINAIVAFHEESNAGKAVAALKKSLAPQCWVKRDNEWKKIEARDLVPGDVVEIKLGDIAPADCKLPETATQSIDVDESALTGESLPVTITAGGIIKSGGVVKRGDAEVVVIRTGERTFIGEALKLVAHAPRELGHFQKIVFKIAKILIAIALVDVVIIFGLKVIYEREAILPVIALCLVLLVSSVPIAMEVVCTAVMAIGSRALAKKSAIVTRLGAIEELAGMEVLCSDKTGTMTLNKLELKEPWTFGKFKKEELLLYAGLALKRAAPDAIDQCIIESIEDTSVLDEYEHLDYVPFDPSTKRAKATVKHKKTGKVMKVAKGAVPVILNMAHNAEEIRATIEDKVTELALKGLRSLGVTRAKQSPNKDDDVTKWEFVGILTFYDPPRPDTRATIEQTKALGVDVKMITGDHVTIAKETCKMLGMGDRVYGKELVDVFDKGKTHLEGVDIKDIIASADGFADVAPKHKYFIVDQLQQQKHITGMTGDGVNDAPALTKADIGIAVSGATDAAKAAADIVLLNPGLSVIVDAMVISRKIFQRMQTFVAYRISATWELLAFFTVAIATLGFALPPIALVVITLLNDFTVVTVAYDKVRPPQKPGKWRLAELAGLGFVVGTMATIGVVGVYFAYSAVIPETGENMFGYKFHEQCYYSISFPDLPVLDSPQCNPACPGFDASDNSCGEYVGWSEAMSVVFLVLAIGGQLKIFAVRCRGFFFTRLPGKALFIASLASWIICFVISLVIDPSLNLGAYVDVEGEHPLVVWNRIDVAMAGMLLLFCLVLFLLEDLCKVFYFFFIDHYRTEGVHEIKRKKQLSTRHLMELLHIKHKKKQKKVSKQLQKVNKTDAK